MILPQTYLWCVAILALGVLLVGSWSVTYKMAGKWPFEFYYVDFAIGAVAVALLLAFTFGDLGYDGFSLVDDVSNASRRLWLVGFGAGAVFNLGNILTMGAASVGGIGMSFGLAFGISLVLGFVLPPFGPPGLHGLSRAAGIGLILLGAAGLAAARAGIASHARTAAASTGAKRSALPAGGIKPVVLAVCGGVLMALSMPLVAKTRGETGYGPYALALFFCGGVFLSSILYSMFFMNLPVHGAPVEPTRYFRGSARSHLLGWFGGALWSAGTVALWVVSAAPRVAHPAAGLSNAAFAAPVLLVALWGLFWGEYADGPWRARIIALLSLVLLAGAVAVFAIG